MQIAIPLLCLLLPITVGCGGPNPASAALLGPQKEAKKMELTLKLAQETYAPGKPIQVSSSLRNGTDAEITIWLSGYWPNHRVTVADANGNEPELTKLGKTCRDAFHPNGGRDKNAPHKIRPGDSYAAYPKIDLNTHFQLKPGRYRVVIVYDDSQKPTPMKVTSDALPFEIK